MSNEKIYRTISHSGGASLALGIVLVALAFVLNMGLAALRRRMGP